MMSVSAIVREMKQNAQKFGNNAAADIAFSQWDVGPKVAVFESDSSLEEIVQTISTQFGFQGPLVARFSKGNEINLPVKVGVQSELELREFIRLNRQTGYATIIRPVVEIKNWFELHYDGTIVYVNVVPGLWDMTRTDPVDLIVIDSKTMTIHQYKGMRIVQTKEPASLGPISIDELESLGKFVASRKNVLDELLEFSNPVFVRGYQGFHQEVYFSNFRESSTGYSIQQLPKNLFRLASETALEQWNGTDDIFVEVSVANRENDQMIYSLAKKLRQKGIKRVFCNSFLSHQAILLRESGLKTIQDMPSKILIMNSHGIKKRWLMQLPNWKMCHHT